MNAWLGERVERRDVLCFSGLLFAAAWLVIWLHPTLSVIAIFYIVSRVGTGLWLFNLYNYTAVAYPTRIRVRWPSPGPMGWGISAPGAGVTLLGPLYGWGPDHLGWILWIVVPGALVPALLIRGFGIRQ